MGAAVLPASAVRPMRRPERRRPPNLEYVKWIPDTNRSSRASSTKNVLVLTGRFGFKTIDVSDPKNPKPLDSFIPADLAAGGWWQNEDMELDTRRKLIIGSLDPRHTDVADRVLPRTGGSEQPGAQERLLRHLLRQPAASSRSATSSRCRPGTPRAASRSARYLWTGGPARRSDQAHSGRS